MSQILDNMRAEIETMTADYTPEVDPNVQPESTSIPAEFDYTGGVETQAPADNKPEDKGEDKQDDDKIELNEELFPSEDEEKQDVAEEEDDDGTMSKEDAAIIDGRVERKLAPLLATAQAKERAAIVDSFISNEGKIFEPFAEPIKALFNDPKFQKMGLKKDAQLGVAVAMTVGWKSLIKMGALRERNASMQSRASITGGSGSSRPASQDAGGIPDVRTMTAENFAKLREGVKSGHLKVGQ